MGEPQIGHRKSCLVLSARFPVVNWRSRPVAKSAYYQHPQAVQTTGLFNKYTNQTSNTREDWTVGTFGGSKESSATTALASHHMT